MVRSVLGFVLLAAAVAKGYELATETGVFLAGRWLSLTLVPLELALGLWLLSGRHPRAARLAALLCFAIFLIASLYQAFAGAASCGCFGKVPISPWYAAGFDVLAIAALFAWKPAGHGSSVGLRVFAPYLVGAVGILTALSAWGYFQFGSLPVALAYLNGERIFVDPPVLHVARGELGGQREVFITVINKTPSRVVLLGSRPACGYRVEERFPLEIPADASKLVRLTVFFGPEPGSSFQQLVTVYTNYGPKLALQIPILGRVTE